MNNNETKDRRNYKVVLWMFIPFIALLLTICFMGSLAVQSVYDAIVRGEWHLLSRWALVSAFLGFPASIVCTYPLIRLLLIGLKSFRLSESGIKFRTIMTFRPIEIEWSDIEKVELVDEPHPNWLRGECHFVISYVDKRNNIKVQIIMLPAHGLTVSQVLADLQYYGVTDIRDLRVNTAGDMAPAYR